jgi:hypothetical protein
MLISKNNLFTLILKDDINNFLEYGFYEIKFDIFNFKEVINFCETTYNHNNEIFETIQKQQAVSYRFNEENVNYYIIEFNNNLIDNVLYLNDVINILNFSKHSGYDYLNINKDYTKLFNNKLSEQNYKNQYNQQHNKQNNLKILEEIYFYSGENSYKYLFRESSLYEILKLFMNGEIEPEENAINKFLYFTYFTENALIRLKQTSKYMVVYDKQKLIDQGVKLKTDKYSKWNTKEGQQQQQYRNDSLGGERKIEYGNNKQKFHNAILKYPDIRPKNLTFQHIDISYEHEAVIKKIIYEHGLVIDILCSPYLQENDTYYSNYNKLINIFEDLINNRL